VKRVPQSVQDHRTRRGWISAFAFLVAGLGLGCGGRTPTGPTSLTSTGTLVRTLQEHTVTVARMEEMSRSSFPFFSVPADRLVVEGDNVYVFEFVNRGAAETDAARVSRDGTTIGTSHVDWIDSPWFYKRDRLIVLYVGRTPRVLAVLQEVLGAPFAGATSGSGTR
jgi:hypothetical protein